jgi:hypothetical protein
VSLGKPGVYAAVTGSIRLESLFLTLEGSGFELVACVKFSKLVVGAGTGSFQVNSNSRLSVACRRGSSLALRRSRERTDPRRGALSRKWVYSLATYRKRLS